MKEVKMPKQTAIEWLFAHLIPHLDWSKVEDRKLFRKLKEEALAMEKEQIVDAYDNGYDLRDDMGSLSSNPRGEQYYNETYGGQDA
jgi:hypothetical protein